LKNNFYFKNKNYHFKNSGTHLLTIDNIDNISNHFFPTYFQKYIEKEFELRIFYLKGKFYSMAIFSQNDIKTTIDYRNYNKEKPNRNIPFQLPKDLEKKLHFFMKKSALDTGSIDMIKDTNGQYVFLEVNPVGQFDWLSINCNYYIEEKIAYFLNHGKHANKNY
jgi:glutathione synthase/RimK-type ligase-like ATP-grasp enzyme